MGGTIVKFYFSIGRDLKGSFHIWVIPGHGLHFKEAFNIFRRFLPFFLCLPVDIMAVLVYVTNKPQRACIYGSKGIKETVPREKQLQLIEGF